MTPDDLRHGTNAGYIAGCHQACCRAGHARQRKQHRNRLYLNGVTTLRVGGTGTRRRIEALLALGYSSRDIDIALGQAKTYTYRLLSNRGAEVYLTTAHRVDEVYRRLCMTLPDASTPFRAAIVKRAKRQAAANGYAPPLAWDNIDDPNESPKGAGYQPPSRVELLEELERQGRSVYDALALLGLNWHALEHWCDVTGHRPLFNSLNRRGKAA